MSERKPRYSYLIGETFKDGDRLCVLTEIEVVKTNEFNSMSYYKLWYPEEDTYVKMLYKDFKNLSGPFGPYRNFGGGDKKQTAPPITKMTIWQAFMKVFPKINCPEGVYLQIMQEVTNELLKADGE